MVIKYPPVFGITQGDILILPLYNVLKITGAVTSIACVYGRPEGNGA